jgi:hypothetical protein
VFKVKLFNHVILKLTTSQMNFYDGPNKQSHYRPISASSFNLKGEKKQRECLAYQNLYCSPPKLGIVKKSVGPQHSPCSQPQDIFTHKRTYSMQDSLIRSQDSSHKTPACSMYHADYSECYRMSLQYASVILVDN